MSNELLDIYDEDENFLGSMPRNEVHAKGLWHKTTHCWLVKKPNTILFQMRSNNLKDNPGKLYTTASGHVSAGEGLTDALKREVQEELGAEIDTENAKLISKGKYTADFKKTDGTEFHDRALCHIFLLETDKKLEHFDFQEEELDGVFALPAKETLELFKSCDGSVKAKGYTLVGDIKNIKDVEFNIEDFLVLPPETPYEKFGLVLEEAVKYLESK